MDINFKRIAAIKDIFKPSFKAVLVIGIPCVLVGALLSGILVFWSQKKMLDAVAERINQCVELEREYNQLKISSNDWSKYKEKFKYERVAGCNSEECLFQGPEAIEGYGYLRGYYSTKEAIDWGAESVICETFTVLDGSTELVDSLIEWVRKGNTINKVNEKGQLVVNISLGDLSLEQQRLIKNSNVNNDVKLKVIRITPEGIGAPACFSFLDIIGVEE